MTQSDFFIEGYGICADEIKIEDISFDKLRSLCEQFDDLESIFEEDIIAYARTLYKEPIEFEDAFRIVKTTGTKTGFIEENIIDYLKIAIKENENIELTACSEFEGDTYLVYEPRYPWFMDDNDKTITKQQLNYIYLKYINMILDKPIDETKLLISYKEIYI